jgi:metal-responsive CopG/Arc/MetJ family transcriptional regulator
MNTYGTDAMEPEKDVHVSLPQTLVAQMEQTAETAHITLDELVQQAVQRYMADRSWTRLRAYGEAQARKVGITTEEDVDRAIHELREEERERQNTERGR